jgi:YebC/PmpR family DNA-binding regulatory protein
MPGDNIKRAIEKGIGGGGTVMEELTYEGYGPGGVAVMIEVMTDNRNRAAGEVRNLLEKGGGNLGASGSVSYIFKRVGSFVFDKSAVDEEQLTMTAIDAGAEDVLPEETTIEVVTKPEDFEKVRDALKAAGLEPASAEITMHPSTTVKLTGEVAQKALKLVGNLEDHDDVQAVHANFDISDEEIERISKLS